jgi:outer membrane lipoprotein-sorting protein
MRTDAGKIASPYSAPLWFVATAFERRERMKQNLTKTIYIMMICICTAVPSATAQQGGGTPSVETIVERSNRVVYYQGDDGQAEVNMRIIDAQGRERSREFSILRRDNLPGKDSEVKNSAEYTGDQRFYVYFNAPPDVRGTVFMVWKHVAMGRDDDRWLYLPDLDLVKRVAASDERTSFVGSHFFYEDVSGRNTNEDDHKLADVTDNYFILDNTPKQPERVAFSHYKMWIHRKTYLPIQTEYYDSRGEAYRRYTTTKVSRPQGFLTVTESKMENLRTGGYTSINYSNVEYNIGLPKEIFTERYLRKPPIKYLNE